MHNFGDTLKWACDRKQNARKFCESQPLIASRRTRVECSWSAHTYWHFSNAFDVEWQINWPQIANKYYSHSNWMLGKHCHLINTLIAGQLFIPAIVIISESGHRLLCHKHLFIHNALCASRAEWNGGAYGRAQSVWVSVGVILLSPTTHGQIRLCGQIKLYIFISSNWIIICPHCVSCVHACTFGFCSACISINTMLTIITMISRKVRV